MIDATRTAPTRDSVEAIAARVPATPPGVPDHRHEIAAAVATIVERFRPERVVLFGSRGRGTPRPDSDADLMLIADPPPSTGEVLDVIIAQRYPLRIGVQVRTPEHIRIALAEGNFFIEDVMTEGMTLFGQDGVGTTSGSGANGGGGQPAGGGPKQATLDWIRKAEEDYQAVNALLGLQPPLWGAVCFHAQQCAEKYLKAFLEERAIRFPRTHDLDALAALAEPLVPGVAPLRPDLDWLSDYAIDVRYPELTAGQADAERALRIATDLRALLRAELGLDSGASSGP